MLHIVFTAKSFTQGFLYIFVFPAAISPTHFNVCILLKQYVTCQAVFALSCISALSGADTWRKAASNGPVHHKPGPATRAKMASSAERLQVFSTSGREIFLPAGRLQQYLISLVARRMVDLEATVTVYFQANDDSICIHT